MNNLVLVKFSLIIAAGIVLWRSLVFTSLSINDLVTRITLAIRSKTIDDKLKKELGPYTRITGISLGNILYIMYVHSILKGW